MDHALAMELGNFILFQCCILQIHWLDFEMNLAMHVRYTKAEQAEKRPGYSVQIHRVEGTRRIPYGLCRGIPLPWGAGLYSAKEGTQPHIFPAGAA